MEVRGDKYKTAIKPSCRRAAGCATKRRTERKAWIKDSESEQLKLDSSQKDKLELNSVGGSAGVCGLGWWVGKETKIVV